MLCLTSEVSCRLQALEEPLRLHHLPELRRLALEGDRPDSGTLHFDKDSFLGSGKLEYLSVHRPGRLAIMPDSFVGLTALATLELLDCHPSHIPAAVTALSGSLASLSLSFNGALQLTDDDVGRLLTLRKLRGLDLRKRSFVMELGLAAAARTVAAQLRYQPALWSPRSLQHLIELSNAFVMRDGRALALRVWQDPNGEEDME